MPISRELQLACPHAKNIMTDVLLLFMRSFLHTGGYMHTESDICWKRINVVFLGGFTEKQTNRETDSEEIFGFGLLYFFFSGGPNEADR